MKTKWIPASLTIAAALLLSGCAQPEAGSDAVTKLGGVQRDALSVPEVRADWYEAALPFGTGHNHRDWEQHKDLSTPNFQVVGYDPLITDYYGTSPDGMACGEARTGPDGRRLAVVHSFYTDVAFVLFDVTDPTKPTKIGELAMANTHVYDVSITPDHKYVLLASSPWSAGGDLPRVPPTLTWRDECSGQTTILDGPEAGLPFYSGLLLVDIQNPRNPFVQDFRPYPWLGVHSVRTAEIKGRTLIMTAVANIAPGTSFYAFLEITDLPGAGPKLNQLGVYEYLWEDYLPESVPSTRMSSNHDGYMAVHPITGAALAYLAYGVHGVIIINIDNPANPTFVSHWDDLRLINNMGGGVVLHHVLPVPEIWDGKHYTFAGEECVSRSADLPTCRDYVLDTTDPAKPELIGVWTLPVDIEWDRGLTFSIHYIAVHNRTFFASTYHGGLWAIDVSTPEALRLMPSIGAFLPDHPSPKPPSGNRDAGAQTYVGVLGNTDIDDAPTILDLDVLDDGTLLVYEVTSGAWTVKFDDTNPAPAPAPWPMVYNES